MGMEKKQIIHISVHQTSKVIAAMHTAVITVLFILPSVFGYWYHGNVIGGIVMLIFVPLFLWVLLYIGYLIACLFYNLAAPWTGGIQVEVADMGIQPVAVPPPPDIGTDKTSQ
jgi:hypothetical protein